MRIPRFLVFGAACALALALPAFSASAQKFTLKISGENPPSGLDQQMAKKFAEVLKEKLGDDLSYELFHTQALGDENVHK
jgi:TRAP-type C4-dicarboxylate transport system substrate-binding protein